MTTQPRDYNPRQELDALQRQTAQPPSTWNFAGVVACAAGSVLLLMALVVFVGWLAVWW